MPGAQQNIASSTHAQRYRRYAGSTIGDGGPDGRLETGLDLRMANGQLWFHPYSGGAPRRIA